MSRAESYDGIGFCVALLYCWNFIERSEYGLIYN